MSARVDLQRAEAAWEAQLQRGKEKLQELMAVLRYTADGMTVSAIATQLSISRDKVYHLQRVLGLREWKRTSRPGRLWAEKPPHEVAR